MSQHHKRTWPAALAIGPLLLATACTSTADTVSETESAPEATAAAEDPSTSPEASEAPEAAESSGSPTPATPSGSPASESAPARGYPQLKVSEVVAGLDIPWDVQQIGQGLLVTERDQASLSLVRNGGTTDLGYPADDVWVAGETGLMSIAVDPGFAKNRRIYTCQGGKTSARSGTTSESNVGNDVRVLAWKLNRTLTEVTKPQVLLSGLAASSGRHGGCRLLIDRAGSLRVGTGDAAVGVNPRDLTSLGGKTLRLDRQTGDPWPTNPYRRADDRNQRYVVTSGHRNVQGLAQRADGSVWSVEHGPDRDDEVNRLRKGGDYGWNPVPGYNESVPMTDQSLSGRQVEARWSSGTPTIAASGAAWVEGDQWGRYDGTLAVAALKGSRLVFMKFTEAGKLRWTKAPARLRDFGRLRSVTSSRNGDLLVTTANGGGDDAVLRIRPRS